MPTASGSGQGLTYCGEEVRRLDPDRYATAMFAPEARRDGLFSLYAFNLEIAKTRESVSEPMLGEIRLQWWREAIEGIYGGTPRRHAVVLPLAELIAEHGLTRRYFDELIDARAQDLSDGGPKTVADLIRYAEGTSSTLNWLALETLGVRSEAATEAARDVGIAWALTGLIRAMPFHLSQGRLYLPEDLITQHGIERRDLLAMRTGRAIAAALKEIADLADAHLRKARARWMDVSKLAFPALLSASIADMHLRRLAKAGYDPFDSRLAAPSRFVGIRLAMKMMIGRY